jgi:hypothetical protein
MRHATVSLLMVVVALFASIANAQVPVPTATMSLGAPTFEGNLAKLPVTVDFQAPFGEVMSFFALDVVNSSALLTGAGTDYAEFGFTLDNDLVLGGWQRILFTEFGSDSFEEYDTINPAGTLGNGVHALGILAVDLTGISPGTLLTVALDGPMTAVGYDSLQFFDFLIPTFDPGLREFVTPEAAITIIPEPSTGLLTLAAFAWLAVRRRLPR